MWTHPNSEYADEHAYRAWAAEDITWGIFNVPEQQFGVLGDVRGLDVVERRNPGQLEAARRCQDRFGITFPLIEADARVCWTSARRANCADDPAGASRLRN